MPPLIPDPPEVAPAPEAPAVALLIPDTEAAAADRLNSRRPLAPLAAAGGKAKSPLPFRLRSAAPELQKVTRFFSALFGAFRPQSARGLPHRIVHAKL